LLRQQLAAEGLFEPSRKRPIPRMPACIGVVTSAEGAVWQDIQHVLRRRFPLVHLLLAATPVQGDSAPAGVVAALERLQHDGRAEVIIVARGGGSAEDLLCFNDERIARAVFACRVPISISGVKSIG
jgi:exodeoxyribonuclease VII large subunit